jgi:thiamine-monophosphate kinase
VVPDDVDDEALRQLACGQRRAAGEVETSVCGGNLSRGTELAIHTTVLGVAEQPLRRDAARASDGVFVVGTPGLAAAGLEVARAGAASADVGEAMRTALEAWRQPRALIAHGVKAAGCAHAAIDLSDGLVLDASRVAEASRVAVVFDAAAVVSEPLAGVASKLGLEALELALYGGEDYALLLMGPVAAALSGWRRIGHCAPPDQLEPGVYLERGGETVPLPVRGFDHFAAESTAE